MSNAISFDLVLICGLLLAVRHVGAWPVRCDPCRCPLQKIRDATVYVRRAKVVDCSSRGLTSLPLNLPQDVDVLFLNDNNLATISVSSFPSLRALYMGNNQISTVTTDTFIDARSLELLDLTGNILEEFTSVETADLEKLATVRGLHTKRVGEDAFSKIGQLKELEIRIDESALPPSLFTNVSNLITLKLKLPSVTSLPKNVIQPLRQTLRTFRLDAPSITQLDPLFFAKMKTLERVELNLPSAHTIPSDAFGRPIDCSKLDAETCKTQDSLSLLSNLRYVTVNGINALPAILFERLPNLESLILTRTGDIPSDIFRSLVRLDDLDLPLNNISSINTDHFKSMMGLKTLNLSHNSLEMVKKDDFTQLNSLKSLDLSYNKIHTFDENALTQQEHTLAHLNLSNNNICSLGEGTFRLVFTLEDINLENNCFGDLNLNLLSGLDQLRRLELQNNDLGSLQSGIFDDLSNLQYLDLSRNRLATIDSDVFAQTYALSWLDLTDNNLSYIPFSSRPPPRLYVALANNPLHCDCQLAWVSLVDVAVESPATCVSPLDHANEPVLSALSALQCATPTTQFEITVIWEPEAVIQRETTAAEAGSEAITQLETSTAGIKTSKMQSAVVEYKTSVSDQSSDSTSEVNTPTIYTESHNDGPLPSDPISGENDTKQTTQNPKNDGDARQLLPAEMRRHDSGQDVTNTVWFWVILALIGVATVVVMLIGLRLGRGHIYKRTYIVNGA